MPVSAPLRVVFLLSVLVTLAVSAKDTSAAETIEDLYARDSQVDLEDLQKDVVRLATLARRHIDAVGLAEALTDFRQKPWKRKANGLHVWGVTVSGMSWYDVGHPDLVGIDVSNITDIEGRYWARLARESADGSGAKVFSLLFPHPETGLSARGLHTCFLLKDGQRILCAGGFEDATR
ncbi:hypothetical protein [Stappia sp.]|uniref:hypothetical protein n=1 Tax=Stappia sp. TaxID=1870903 RepID=UPI003C7D5599